MSDALHLVTGEYPPRPGGVSDYTRLVAVELVRRGIECHVWTAGPAVEGRGDGVAVHRLGSSFDRCALHKLGDRLLAAKASDRMVVQYVPHAFGNRGMNLGFAVAIDRVARRRPVELMFHEVAYPWVRRPLRHNLVSAANRWMVWRMCRHAARAFVSIPAWERVLRPLAPRHLEIDWAPVPSNIPRALEADVVATRSSYRSSDGAPLVGHFGTFGGHITPLLDVALEHIADLAPNVRVLLIGRGGKRWLQIKAGAVWASRAQATDELSPRDTGASISSCDVMLQPYPDGVSTRRGTMMACLANGAATVTTLGPLSEPFWRACDAAITQDAGAPQLLSKDIVALLDDDKRRNIVSLAAQSLYDSEFSIGRTVDRLLSTRRSKLSPTQ